MHKHRKYCNPPPTPSVSRKDTKLVEQQIKALVMQEQEAYLRPHRKYSKLALKLPSINLAIIDESEREDNIARKKEISWRYRIKTQDCEPYQSSSRRLLSNRFLPEGLPWSVRLLQKSREKPFRLVNLEGFQRLVKKRSQQYSKKLVPTEPAVQELPPPQRKSVNESNPELQKRRRMRQLKRRNQSQACAKVRFSSSEHTLELLKHHQQTKQGEDALAGWQRDEDDNIF